MLHLKARLAALLLITISAGIIYYNWHQLWQEGRYSMKVASFAPVGVIGGIFLLLFPARGGKPKTGGEIAVVMLVFGIGLALGLLNWYLMDPGFFQW